MAPRPPHRLLVAALLTTLLSWGDVRLARAGDLGRELVAALEKSLAAKDGETRKAAVLDVGRWRGHLDAEQMHRTTLLLRKAFDDEPERETRRLMVRALARLESTAAWVPVVLAAFGDRDPAVARTARLEALGGKRDFLEVVARLYAEDIDPTFRARLLLLLGDRRRHDAVPFLLEAIDDASPRVATAAVEALETISGQAFGYDAAPWRRWRSFWERTEAARQKGAGAGETQADPGPPDEEPPPRTTRGLVPDFFGLPLGAKDILFAVDISGSVGTGGMDRARRELVACVERLGTDVHIAALFFADEVRVWQPNWVQATPEAKAGLVHFLRGLAPGKQTDVFTPLNVALTMVQQRVEAKTAAGETFRTPVALVVVSDGRDNMAKTPVSVVEERLDRLDLQRAAIHAVVLGGKAHPLMAEIARYGGGHFVVVE